MKKNRVFMFAAAVAALLLAGCDKGASYSSFELSTADFRGADGAKTQWTANGLYWEDGDAVVINRIEHTIHGSGSSWSTSGTKTNNIDGYFYVAYPVQNNTSMSADGTTVSGVDFSDGVVPLACKGKTNKLTLYPCCAVIKVSDWVSGISFYNEDGEAGTQDGKVLAEGSINVVNNTVFGDTEIDYNSPMSPVESIDGYNYFVIPMDGGAMQAVIDFDYSQQTNGPVELRAGYLYTVDI